MSKIFQLRMHFDRCGLENKRKYIEDFRETIKGSDNQEYKWFLNECVQKYNAQAKSHNDDLLIRNPAAKKSVQVPSATVSASKKASPDATSSSSGIVGRWRKTKDGSTFFTFSENNSFETDDFPGISKVVKGIYSYDGNKVKLKTSSGDTTIFSVTVSGKTLILKHSSGSSGEYVRLR